MDKGGRKSVDQALDEYAKTEVRPGHEHAHSLSAAYENHTDDERLLAIGGCLVREGDTYLDRRPYHREWLAEKGLSPEAARIRYTEWRAEVDARREKRRSGDGEPVGDDG